MTKFYTYYVDGKTIGKVKSEDVFGDVYKKAEALAKAEHTELWRLMTKEDGNGHIYEEEMQFSVKGVFFLSEGRYKSDEDYRLG